MTGVIDALKTQAAPAWDAYTRHPFVEGVKEGTLPRAGFLRYLKQDYLFLIHFARAWALAAVKSERIDEVRQCVAIAHGLADGEMALHIAACAAAGVGHDDLLATKEQPATLAYTRYVMDVGLRGDLLDLLAALAPCVFGYGDIGARLGAETGGPPADHPYAEWIGAYAGQDYQDVCAAVDGLIESVARRALGADFSTSPRWPGVVSIFRHACEREADFWDIGYAAGGA